VTETDLLMLAAELVSIPSVSRHEDALSDRIESELRARPWLEVERLGNNVVAKTSLGRSMRVILAGHLDTVPPAGNADATIEADTLWGVGSADMKGGLAVLLDLASSLRQPTVDVTWCFYEREEVERAEDGLVRLWNERPDLVAGDVAILSEPTACRIEAGCQGTMRAVIHMRGVRAHTARPYTGRNAIHRLVPVLQQVAAWPGRRVVLDGCEYVEQLQAVAVEGGVAPNVVPDDASMTVNYRFAPDRSLADARHYLSELFDMVLDPELGDSWAVTDEALGAPPALDHPVLSRLLALSGEAPQAKVGWTDVATFWAHGVPATNFGPGDPLLAHHPDERVDRRSLERAHSCLAALLS